MTHADTAETPEVDVSAFKAYDVRGVIGETIDADFVGRVARAAAEVLDAQSAAVGFDARETSQDFARAAVAGLRAAGCDATELGLCGTEEVYFEAGSQSLDLGIMITASHNPIEYNGIKLVGPSARPLTEKEFADIRRRTSRGGPPGGAPTGRRRPVSSSRRAAYARRLASLVDAEAIGPLRIVFNCGNGAAGPTLKAILSELERRGASIEPTVVYGDPDAAFPNGIPNPLLPENHAATAAAVAAAGADCGVAFDGDFDRCFLFDECGEFVAGEYAVALLAKASLARHPHALIVHDPRVTWAIASQVDQAGGAAVASQTGHAFIKATMRAARAPYGGEMSAHHYFRDFYYCDSGMLPWMMIAELVSRGGRSLGDLVGEMRRNHPSSGEINFRVSDQAGAIRDVEERLLGGALRVSRLDGLSAEFADWRVNLRASNTENLLRLNVETRGSRALLDERTAELSAVLKSWIDA
jgi:phosphomannomutase